jgi:metallophosphoesterase superfamily enzyme
VKRAPNIVVVSDLHVGSNFALCPPELDTGDSPTRIFLWDAWSKFAREVVKYQPFILVVNGDVTEGRHHRANDLTITGLVQQWRAAVRTLRPLCSKAEAVYFTEGTECHTLDDEHDLAEELGAVKGPDGYAHYRLRLKVNGLAHEFRHHIGTSARPWTEVNALQAALVAEREQARLAGEGQTDILVSAHRHTGAMIRTDGGMSITSASWQFPTRHVRKVVPTARPVVGGLILDYSRAARGEWPNVIHRHYRPEGMNGYAHE